MAAPTALAASLIAFQADRPHIPFDSINPHFKNRYAGLPVVAEKALERATKYDLGIIQFPCTLDSGMPGLRTILIHKSGESLEDVMPLAVDKPGPQAQGSALTYARRYAILSVLGLVADEDDDGEAAQKAAPKDAAVEGQRVASSTASEEDLTAKILAAADKMGVKDATDESIAASKAKRSPAEHLVWLGTTLKAAEDAVKQFELQVPA